MPLTLRSPNREASHRNVARGRHRLACPPPCVAASARGAVQAHSFNRRSTVLWSSRAAELKDDEGQPTFSPGDRAAEVLEAVEAALAGVGANIDPGGADPGTVA